MFLTYPGCRHKPSRATPLELRGFQRGPQAPLAVPRASELAAAFSLPFWPDKKEGGMASEETVSYRAEPGFASLPKNVRIRQTSTAGSRPRPTKRRKRAMDRNPRVGRTPAGMHTCLPLQMRVPRTRAKNVAHRANGHGGGKARPIERGERATNRTPRAAQKVTII